MNKELTKAKQFKSMEDVYNYADNRNQELEVENFDHNSAYELEHRDGSKFFITNVLLELVRLVGTFGHKIMDETIYIVYSEHHQPLTYMESDLKSDPKLVELKKKK